MEHDHKTGNEMTSPSDRSSDRAPTLPFGRFRLSLLAILSASTQATVVLAPLTVHASTSRVFNSTQFVEPGKFAIGIEPEFTMSSGAGVGANFKFTHGLNDYMDLSAILGTGNGPRRFRTGAQAVFDIFPDAASQPGLGLATQMLYYKLPQSGRLEVTAFPYLHKTFATKQSEIDPFIAIPHGWALGDGPPRFLSSFNVGLQFLATEHLRYTFEIGMAIAQTESTISGGVTYYQ